MLNKKEKVKVKVEKVKGAKYTMISLTLRRGDMEPTRHLQVLLPNRRWMVPTKNCRFFSIIFPALLPGDDFKALPPRSTNFSWESFSGGTFFISWLSGSPLTSRTVIWSLDHGPTMQSRWKCRKQIIFADIFSVVAYSKDCQSLLPDIAEEILELHFWAIILGTWGIGRWDT